MTKFLVEAAALNLRTQPIVVPSTKIITLPQSQMVEKLEEAQDSAWWLISTTINHLAVTGYVNSAFLKPVNTYATPPKVQEVGAVHMSSSKPIKRSEVGGRAFPLNEAGQPRRASAQPAAKVDELRAIINWLKADESARYLKKSGETYCNIYAYDYCYLANVYLPRVWWTSKAIARIQAGNSVAPVYDQTIRELNANSLHNWLSEYGEDFGWRRSIDLTELQDQANNGAVCVISARNRELNRSGHICLAVPESATHKAVRKNGVVNAPLQSNVGESNFRYGARIWWTSGKFSSFSFWFHA